MRQTRQTSIILLFAFVLAPAGAPAALAQRRVPDTGMVAIGGSIGAALPEERRLDNGLELAGNIEGYLTPRLSIRGQLGSAWFDVTGAGDRTIRPLFADGNLVYNWERGQWHPYVTAGVGLYRYHASRESSDDDDRKAGFDLGGGFEYFFTRRATITGEVLYHNVGQVRTAREGFPDGSFWTIAMGGKAYLGR
jgi:hypothetical protein